MGDGIAPEAVADEVDGLLGTGRQVEPFSARDPGFGLEAAYAAAALVDRRRRARGETAVGRKIGFTNRAIWAGRGISAPMWGWVYDTTLAPGGPDAALSLDGFAEPRIEPEVVLHLAATPGADMTDVALAACVDWAAPAFEIVHSIFPGWRFEVADATAAAGLHGALVIGERLPLAGAAVEALSRFTVTLASDTGVVREGAAANVLGGPLTSLRFLIEEIARRPGSDPLRAGEVVTTGTLTDAFAVRPGETWTATFEGIGFAPLRLRFR